MQKVCEVGTYYDRPFNFDKYDDELCISIRKEFEATAAEIEKNKTGHGPEYVI